MSAPVLRRSLCEIIIRLFPLPPLPFFRQIEEVLLPLPPSGGLSSVYEAARGGEERIRGRQAKKMLKCGRASFFSSSSFLLFSGRIRSFLFSGLDWQRGGRMARKIYLSASY